MSESIAVQIDRGLEAVNRLEAKVNHVACCSECAFKDKITVKNDLGDGYCPTADRKLTGYAHNRKTLSQPRKCLPFQPNGKET